MTFWKKWFHKPLSPDPALTDWDRRFMAYHEAGHAVVSHFLPEQEDLILVTIDPSSEAFGMIRTRPRLHHNATKAYFESLIAVFLAGRLSEEMFLHTLTTSCIHDLAAVQDIAADMVAKYGMGEHTGLAAIQERNDFPVSNQYVETVCVDVQKIIRDAEQTARKVLDEHWETVHELAQLLLKQKTLNEKEIREFFDDEK